MLKNIFEATATAFQHLPLGHSSLGEVALRDNLRRFTRRFGAHEPKEQLLRQCIALLPGWRARRPSRVSTKLARWFHDDAKE